MASASGRESILMRAAVASAAAVLFFSGALSAAVSPASPESAVELLCRRADDMHLAESPYWHTLGHYRKRLTGGSRSLVDDPDFFLAPNGKNDPHAEVQATIRNLFGPSAEQAAATACRFPARLAWLREQLDPEAAGISVPRCEAFETLLANIDPVSVTLVFPTAYLNSPASLFGHTLLHIRSRSGSALLSNAVNYAASTKETNGLIFAFKGIFGLYPGYYNVTPYSRKIQQYNDIDQRDIWEYELTFTPAEIRRMMAHIYELRGIYSDYYFFTENCSYELLFVLDAARPGLQLVDRVRPWVIPLDTVKQVAKLGLVRHVTYRPSKATCLRDMAQNLSPKAQNQVIALANGDLDPGKSAVWAENEAEAIHVLDTTAEYLQMLRGKKRLDQAAFAPRFFRVLAARSALAHPELSEIDFPRPAQPEKGHGSLRLSLAIGSWNDKGYEDISLRPAYHESLDPDEGYIAGSAIEFMGLTLRRWNTPARLQLERLDIIRIESLSPRDRFIKPTSWKVGFGLEREAMDDDRTMAAFLGVGGGYTWTLPGNGLFYIMAETDLRNDDSSPSWSCGFGGSCGIRQKLGKRWKVKASLRALHYPLGAEHNRFEAVLGQRVTLRPNVALVGEILRRNQWHEWETEASLSLRLYF